MKELTIEVAGEQSVSGVVHGEDCGSGVGLVLGHGAGNDMTNPLLVAACEGLARLGHASMRFNFLYKEKGNKAPDPRARLEKTYTAAVEAFRESFRDTRGDALKHLVIGGKSMGGRIASLLAAGGLACDGLVFLGYPLHPAGEPERLRTEHLPSIRPPMLFVQGTRDPLCDLTLLRPVLDDIGTRATLYEIEGGDHSFGVLKSANRTIESVYDEVVSAIDRWLESRFGGKV